MSLKIITKNFFFGFLAGFSLLILYFFILTLANSFSHAISQFSEMWYWILILAAGFGLQVGLYTFIREKLKTAPAGVLAASGGVSTGSMIVCCLHHLVDVLPILGLAAIAVFLIQYQVFFIVFGILTNLIGISIMLEIIQKHRFSQNQNVSRYNMGFIKKIFIAASLPVLLITFLLINNQPETTVAAMNLPGRVDSQSGITFEVNPVEFSLANPLQFEIKIDTHSGSLDFDLTKISILEDDNGNQYQPLNWQGSTGAHHLEGILIFPQLANQPKSIKLIIKDTLPRTFEWEIK